MRRFPVVVAIFGLFISATAGQLSAWTPTTPDPISVLQITGVNDEYGDAIAVDGDGNTLLAGQIDSPTDMDPGPGTTTLQPVGGIDIVLAKFNNAGNLVWAKAIGGTNSDQPTAIAVDSTGNIFMTGAFNGTVDFDPSANTVALTALGGSKDSFVAKYSPAGELVWVTGIASDGTENARSVALDSLGNIFVAGDYGSNTTAIVVGSSTTSLTSTNNTDTFFMKLDATGSYVWAKKVGNTAADAASTIRIDSTNNIFLLGYFQLTANFDTNGGTTNLISAGRSDIYLAKFDSSGSLLWARGFGGTQDDDGFSLALDRNGNAYFGGYFKGTADFDPTANTSNLVTAGGDEGYIAKVNADGSMGWAHRFGSNGDDWVYGVTVDLDGNVFATGFFFQTADFDPGSGTDTVSVPSYGVFVVKVDTTGQYQWAKGFGGANYDEGKSIIADEFGNVFVTGFFSGISDFDPGTGTATLTSNGGARDIFILRLNRDGSAAIDVLAPTVAWTSPTSPSTSRTVIFTATFNEAVSGIAASDFTNTGTATGCVFTPSAASTMNSITVSVKCTSDGTVIPQLAANSVRDSSFNTGPTAASSAMSVTIATTSGSSGTPSSTTTVSPTTTVAPSTPVATTTPKVATVKKTALPSTGSSSAPLALAALFSVALGVAMMRRRTS